jgi:hypothetical protein
MKTKSVLALVIILVLLMAGSAPAAADGAEVPFNTMLMVQPTFAGPLIIDGKEVGFRLSVTGQGEVMHLGSTTWHADMWVNTTTAPGTLGANMIFTAANGDTLTGSYLGASGEPLPGINHCVGEFVITGGTGRFENVAGGGEFEGFHPLDGSPGPLYFWGTLSMAGE